MDTNLSLEELMDIEQIFGDVANPFRRADVRRTCQSFTGVTYSDFVNHVCASLSVNTGR